MPSTYSFQDLSNDSPDALLFGGVFVVGLIIQVFGRVYLNWPAIFVTILLCLLICFYAYLVIRYKNTKLSINAAADNFYFIGFLFTIITLAIALYRYSSDTTNTDGQDPLLTIIGDLGIGLSTTIVGLFLRMFFSLFRSSTEEVEEFVHNDIKETARRLQLSFAAVSQKTETANNRMVMAAEEMEHSIKKIIKILPSSIDKTMKGSLETINNVENTYINSVSKLIDKINSVEIKEKPFDDIFDSLKGDLESNFDVIKDNIDMINLKLSSISIPENVIHSIYADFTSKINTVNENYIKIVEDNIVTFSDVKFNDQVYNEIFEESIKSIKTNVQELNTSILGITNQFNSLKLPATEHVASVNGEIDRLLISIQKAVEKVNKKNDLLSRILGR
jgi:hypothetical protein